LIINKGKINQIAYTCVNMRVASNVEMKSRYFITTLIIACCLTNTFTSCEQSQSKRDEQIISKNTNGLQFDTSRTAIIPFDQKGNYPFDNSYKPITLTQEEIKCIDSLLIVCVTDYNDSLDKEHSSLDKEHSSLDKDHKQRSIDLKKYNYRKQVIAVTNKNGHKEVWVNCFCEIWDGYRWKSQIMSVEDGGRCYFNFKIDLTTKKYYNLEVNGTG
jgi:hypothetical protein